MGALSSRVEAWRLAGRTLSVKGRQIFIAETPGGGTPIVIVHGYPGSSFDFAGVMPLLGTRVVAMDLLGYGLSDKPTGSTYSLFEQADLVEAVVADAGIDRCVLLGHDMGTTVVSELLSRSNAGRLGFAVERVFLTNGSIFIDMAQLTRGQRLGLRLAGRRTPLPLPAAYVRRNLRESIAPGTNVTPEALDDLAELIRHRGGDRLLTKQIRYIVERRAHQQRWTAALVDFTGPLTAIWGQLDPIAIPAMPAHLASLRPGTEVVALDGVGHWPSIEAPKRLAGEIRSRI